MTGARGKFRISRGIGGRNGRDESGLNLNRIGALILAIFFLALLAFRGESARNSFPVRLGTEEGYVALRARADAYLSQTRRLLGNRFQEDFYRSAVETRLFSLSVVPESALPTERACFDFLNAESDPCAAEVLAFLDEVEEGASSLPDDVFYLAGNPIDAYAARLALPPSSPIIRCIPRRALRTLPLSFRVSLAFSLITLLASVFSPVLPIGGAAGNGITVIQVFFVSLVRCFCFLPVFSAKPTSLCGVLKVFTRSRAPEDRKGVCLLR